MKYLFLYTCASYILAFVLLSDLFLSSAATYEYYYSAVQVLRKKWSVLLLLHQVVVTYVLLLQTIIRVVFKEVKEHEQFEILHKCKYKLMTLSITLVFLYLSFDYLLALSVVLLLSAWGMVWLLKLRGEKLWTQEAQMRRQRGKSEVVKLLLLYAAMQTVLAYAWLACWNSSASFFQELLLFEIGSMSCYLLLHFVKFAVHAFELLTFHSFASFHKLHFFMLADLLLHVVKLIFQLYCLVRFTLYYNYPLFWARDIFLSAMISLEYVKKYLHTLRTSRLLLRFLTDTPATHPLADCGICLQSMKRSTQLACKHSFHKDCLL